MFAGSRLDRCYRIGAEPSSASALFASDTQMFHVDYRTVPVVPDSIEFVLRLKNP